METVQSNLDFVETNLETEQTNLDIVKTILENVQYNLEINPLRPGVQKNGRQQKRCCSFIWTY